MLYIFQIPSGGSPLLLEGNVVSVTSSDMVVRISNNPFSNINEKLPLGSLSQISAEFSIPLTLVRESKPHKIEVGECIYIKYIRKDEISSQDVFMASTDKKNLDNTENNNQNLDFLVTRDEWTVSKQDGHYSTSPHYGNFLERLYFNNSCKKCVYHNFIYNKKFIFQNQAKWQM